MGKNIVVFSDGTGQEGGKGTNTNVYKLFSMVLDRSPEQRAPGYGGRSGVTRPVPRLGSADVPL